VLSQSKWMKVVTFNSSINHYKFIGPFRLTVYWCLGEYSMRDSMGELVCRYGVKSEMFEETNHARNFQVASRLHLPNPCY
jgi:hypothetical protein